MNQFSFTIDYGKVRLFHSESGYIDTFMDVLNLFRHYTTVLIESTGDVIQKIPDDFPTENPVSIRKYYK
ncbi:hypothetical protein [Litoribaculum gwangyangense]|uniref:Uncharacterized protein n=1 Tax=Litoribaculum gwangyangense TaxID=1130722 RepID=A0ABP9CGB3_9FLAO